MPLVVKDRVLETTSSTGTGTITLGGAVAGYQSFSVIGNGNTTYYSIVGGTEWEVGIGTYTSAGTTLSRDTVLESSNAGSLVNFSAGTKNVFVTYPAEESVDQDTAQTLTNKTLSVDSNTISGIAASSFVLSNASGNIDGAVAQKAIPAGVVVGTTDSQTLTNKTISGASNTLSNIANSSLTNSAITINGTSTSLGGSISVGTVTSVSAGDGMSFTTITGTGSVTMGTPSSISNTSTNSVSAGTHTHALSGELVEATAGSALYYGARAWVQFTGSGSATLVGSVNVTSVARSGTGAYTVNLTTAMSDTNGCLVHGYNAGQNADQASVFWNSTSQVGFNVTQSGSGQRDSATNFIAVFR